MSSSAAAVASSSFDVVVLGAGPAGLSSALGLGRAVRSVLVVDSAVYRNARAEHMHNVLGSDGTPPPEFKAHGRQQIEALYKTVKFSDNTKVTAVLQRKEATKEDEASFPAKTQLRLTLQPTSGSEADPRVVYARRMILAVGMVDQPPLPTIPGYDELWGTLIASCPYCHGYEVRGAVPAEEAAGGAAAGGWALLIRDFQPEHAAAKGTDLEGWVTALPPRAPIFYHYTTMIASFNTGAGVPPLTIFTHGQKAEGLFSPEQLQAIARNGITIHEGPVASLAKTAQGNLAVTLAPVDGGAPAPKPLQFKAMFTRGSALPPELVRSLRSPATVSAAAGEVAAAAAPIKVHPLFKTVEVDMMGKTSVPNIYAAGDIMEFRSSVPLALGSGVIAAAGANGELGVEDFNAA